MNNEQIVNSIKLICKEHDITITKLEETLGMSQGLISRWNKSDPSLSKIIDIADYFNISLDEVVGFKNVVNDKFIEKLLTQTTNGILKWNIYDNSSDTPKQPRVSSFDNEFLQIPSYNQTELSYYACINNGYISVYGCYKDNNATNPSDIKLFIQPNYNSNLILQDYSKEQLISLWLKILFSLKEAAPDEIKAEELKRTFVLEDNEKECHNSVQNKNIYSIINNPSFIKSVQAINTKEFQNAIKTFYSPEFQNALQSFNKIRYNLNECNLSLPQKKD